MFARVNTRNTAAFLSHRLFSASPRVFSLEKVCPQLKERVQAELGAICASGTQKAERIISTAQSAAIGVVDQNTNSTPSKTTDSKRFSIDKEAISSLRAQKTNTVVNFCANNYLGLSDDPHVIELAKKYVDEWGNGLSSVRFICGTQTIHKELELMLSNFTGKQDTILYSSCFDANGGVFEALLGADDAIISDSLNHASIIDGIRLSKAKRYRYDNCNMEQLEKRLIEATEKNCKVKMIVTDGVFSMDGRIAPLKDICDLSDKYGAVVFVDDCHGTGVLGETGRGTPEFCGVQDRVHILNSTLGKALGGASGGFTSADADIIELLRNKSRPYLFSNSLAPSVVGGAVGALNLLTDPQVGPELLARLRTNTARFRQRMTNAGFKLLGDSHPVSPVMLGDARLAADFSSEMLRKGIYVIGFSFPVVPQGLARIRVQLSAAHTESQIDEAVDAFIATGKQMSVI